MSLPTKCCYVNLFSTSFIYFVLLFVLSLLCGSHVSSLHFFPPFFRSKKKWINRMWRQRRLFSSGDDCFMVKILIFIGFLYATGRWNMKVKRDKCTILLCYGQCLMAFLYNKYTIVGIPVWAKNHFFLCCDERFIPEWCCPHFVHRLVRYFHSLKWIVSNLCGSIQWKSSWGILITQPFLILLLAKNKTNKNAKGQ